jgi:hypothetical protein
MDYSNNWVFGGGLCERGGVVLISQLGVPPGGGPAASPGTFLGAGICESGLARSLRTSFGDCELTEIGSMGEAVFLGEKG